MEAWIKKANRFTRGLMEIIQKEIPDILVVKPRIFRDNRGYFLETYRTSWLEEAGLNLNFVQDNKSFSERGVLRGLHYQIEQPQDKLITCLQGSILDVAVDIRKGSPTFGKYVTQKLDDETQYQMLVPKGFAHGFLILSDTALVSYKCTNYYYKEGERSIFWNDPGINIDWGVETPILSDRDLKNPLLKELKPEDLF